MRKRNYKQSEPVFRQQLYCSKGYKWSETHRVQPNNIPIISRQKRTKGKAAAKDSQREVILLINTSEEDCHEHASKGDSGRNRDH